MGQFTSKKKPDFLGGLVSSGDTHKPTHTPTHEYTHTDTPVVRERKTRRVQLLMRESTVDQLDAYAKVHDTSRNDIIQMLVEEFLKKNV